MGQQEEFWQRCRQALPDEDLGDRYALRRMGNTPALSESLLGMVTSGAKTGLFSRPEELEAAGLTPSPGDHVVFMDFTGTPRCLVRMLECRNLKYSEVTAAETACESPAARDLEAWRGIHRRYWTPILAAEGLEFTPEVRVFFQRFKMLYAEPRAARPPESEGANQSTV